MTVPRAMIVAHHDAAVAVAAARASESARRAIIERDATDPTLRTEQQLAYEAAVEARMRYHAAILDAAEAPEEDWSADAVALILGIVELAVRDADRYPARVAMRAILDAYAAAEDEAVELAGVGSSVR